MSKAIVEASTAGDYFAKALEVARLIDAGEAVPEADYSLGFSSTAQLFSELTSARMALLEALKDLGPVSIHALAKQVGTQLQQRAFGCDQAAGSGSHRKGCRRQDLRSLGGNPGPGQCRQGEGGLAHRAC